MPPHLHPIAERGSQAADPQSCQAGREGGRGEDGGRRSPNSPGSSPAAPSSGRGDPQPLIPSSPWGPPSPLCPRSAPHPQDMDDKQRAGSAGRCMNESGGASSVLYGDGP